MKYLEGSSVPSLALAARGWDSAARPNRQYADGMGGLTSGSGRAWVTCRPGTSPTYKLIS
jgi:hypothetical protein